MAEAEALCDRVAFIDKGGILAVESPKVLSTWVARFERIDAEGVPPAVREELANTPGVAAVQPLADDLTRIELESETAAGPVLKRLVEAGVSSIRTSRPSLEEFYLGVFGERGLRV